MERLNSRFFPYQTAVDQGYHPADVNYVSDRALRGFDIPYLLTNGGPGNASELMSTYMYKKAFSK